MDPTCAFAQARTCILQVSAWQTWIRHWIEVIARRHPAWLWVFEDVNLEEKICSSHSCSLLMLHLFWGASSNLHLHTFRTPLSVGRLDHESLVSRIDEGDRFQALGVSSLCTMGLQNVALVWSVKLDSGEWWTWKNQWNRFRPCQHYGLQLKISIIQSRHPHLVGLAPHSQGNRRLLPGFRFAVYTQNNTGSSLVSRLSV